MKITEVKSGKRLDKTATADYNLIPQRTMEGLKQAQQQFQETGKIPPMGSFMTALFNNDLVGAVLGADSENREAIFHIVAYVYNRMPGMLKR